MRPRLQKLQRGLGIIAAIVILVIMAALGTFIMVLSTTQQYGSALDVDGARAYASALSGSEWGVAQALAGNCNFGVASFGPFNNMTITVTGAVVATGNAVEAGLGAICLVTATACNLPAGGACPGNTASPNYVERQIIALPER